jgi:glycosyltransferase involved in cell wall biosynthesis
MLDSNVLTLSVIIPSRNRASYLLPLLLLLTKTNSQSVEFIVVDNSDEKLEVDTNMFDSRFRFIRNETRLSMSSNWELGLKSSVGRFRCFLGDDDGIIPSEFDKFILQIQNSEADAIVTGFSHYRWPVSSGEVGSISIWLSTNPRPLHMSLSKNLYKIIGNIYFPMPYARSVFSKELESQVRIRQSGRFFTSSSPDINSGASIALVAKSIDYVLNVVPFIVGTSSANNGAHLGSLEVKRDFRNLNDIDWLFELGSMPENANYIAYVEAIAQARKALGYRLELPRKTSLIWQTLNTDSDLMTASTYLRSIFKEHNLLIWFLFIVAKFTGKFYRIFKMTFWATKRFFLNRERYYREANTNLKSIYQGSMRLEELIRQHRNLW